MKSICDLLKIDDLAVLFLAPPGWGKTRMILEIKNSFEGRIFFVSPLRALSEEFRKNFEEDELYSKSKVNFKIYVNTVEKFLIDKSKFEISMKDLLVIDEIHLFYLWQNFREKLLSFREEVFPEFNKALCLSATMTKELKKRYLGEFFLNYENNIEIDLGNLKLKNLPQKHCRLYKNNFFISLMILTRLRKGRVLIFVKYRREVQEYIQWAEQLGIKALGCVGGEAYQFTQQPLKEAMFFVSTTVLSHGVNLPKIKTVIINYKLDSEIFFLQMISRAGRAGEEFQVYSMNDNLNFKQTSVPFLQWGELIKCMLRRWF